MYKMTMTIALFTDTYTPTNVNGVAKTLNRWINYLKKEGHTVRVYAPKPQSTSPGLSSEEVVERYKSFPFFIQNFKLPSLIH